MWFNCAWFFNQARLKKKEDAANAKYEDAMKKAKVSEMYLIK